MQIAKNLSFLDFFCLCFNHYTFLLKLEIILISFSMFLATVLSLSSTSYHGYPVIQIDITIINHFVYLLKHSLLELIKKNSVFAFYTMFQFSNLNFYFI